MEANNEIEETAEPANKKPKHLESIDSFIASIANSKERIQAVLADEYYKPVPFTKVYVAQVRDIKLLSKVISVLNQKMPLKDLAHLKRAFRKEVILIPTSYLKTLTIQYYVEEHVNELREAFEYFKISDVPAVAPKSRKQYVECCRSWSCNFHPDNHVESLFNATLFNKEEIIYHRLFMGMAFEVARFYMIKENEHLEPSDILSADLNATVVIDPRYQSVVAVAFDNRLKHPLQHSAMLAIDNVAKTQNGGVWVEETDNFKMKYRGIGNNELILHLKQNYPNVKFGAKKYFTKEDLKEKNIDPSGCPYLCTYYNVYLIREPCVMCSMGLLHARSSRIFYYKKHSMGGVHTKTKLHCVPSLNHHFEVFTDF